MSTVTLNPIHSFTHSLTHSLSVVFAARGSENRPRRLRDSFKQEHIKHDVRVNTRAGGETAGDRELTGTARRFASPLNGSQPLTCLHLILAAAAAAAAPPPPGPTTGVLLGGLTSHAVQSIASRAQWRRKQFASGGAINFFRRVPLFSLVPSST